MTNLPENITPLCKNKPFNFSCHVGVSCFTECCRELELALSPYDLLRLRKTLNMSSRQFLDQHAVIEWNENDPYPMVYLGMVDDGRASCPFVTAKGCLVYRDRPGPCRTYPLGRGLALAEDGATKTSYILVREPHCAGFNESEQQTITEWEENQELRPYNIFNEMMTRLCHHPKAQGKGLSKAQADLFIATIYDIDSFKADRRENDLDNSDDEALLTFAFSWLEKQLFAE